MTRYWAEHAWLGGERAEPGVLIEVEGERIAAVALGARARDGATILRGLTLPGLANAHSHAFHRALRGRTHRGGGTFWTWREDMYAVAERLDPDSLPGARPRGVRGDGAGRDHLRRRVPLPAPRRRRHALRRPERDGRGADRGGGRGRDPDHAARHVLPRGRLRRRRPRARSCASPTATRRPGRSARRRCAAAPHARIGAAIHSVRAVPAGQLATVADWARERGAPLHVAPVRAARGERGLPGRPRLHARRSCSTSTARSARARCAVHATHLTDERRRAARRHRTRLHVRDHRARPRRRHRPGPRARGRGSPLCLGSDSHAVIDLFEEARAVELDERLRTERRGHFAAAELLRAATQRPRRARLARGRADRAGRARRPRDGLARLGAARRRRAGHAARVARVFAATAGDVREVRRRRPPDRRRRAATRRSTSPRALRGGATSRERPDRQHRRARHQRPRARRRPARADRGRRARARRRASSQWAGPRAATPEAAARRALRRRRPRGDPRLRRLARPPRVRRRPRARVRRPHGRRAPTRPAASARPSPPRAPPPRPSSTPTTARLVAEARRSGTTTIECKSGYGLTVEDEARSLARRRPPHRRGHLPRRARRRARVRGRPAAYVELVTGPMLDACAPARPLDRRLLRAGRLRRRPGARDPAPPASSAGLHPARARQPARPRPGRAARGRARRRLRRPRHPRHRRRRRRARRRRHGRDAAARRGVLDPRAPTPTPAGCSTPA